MTVQGLVNKQQPDGMSHRGLGKGAPRPPLDPQVHFSGALSQTASGPTACTISSCGRLHQSQTCLIWCVRTVRWLVGTAATGDHCQRVPGSNPTRGSPNVPAPGEGLTFVVDGSPVLAQALHRDLRPPCRPPPFQVFRCTVFPDGRLYMVFAPTVRCWDGGHMAMVVIASLYILLVILGTPCYLSYVLHTARKRRLLHRMTVLDNFGFAFARYDPHFEWWECMLLLRRFLVALVAVLIDNAMLQAACVVVALVLLLVCHTTARPFRDDTIDNLDVFSIIGTVVYALAGLLLYASITLETQGRSCARLPAPSAECDHEGRLKLAIAVLLLLWTASTIACCVYSSWLCVRNLGYSKRGLRLLSPALAKHHSPRAAYVVDPGEPAAAWDAPSPSATALPFAASVKTYQYHLPLRDIFPGKAHLKVSATPCPAPPSHSPTHLWHCLALP